jgi:hypothetical protein
MEDRYRLVFRGEVLDGQHTAVVRKRLGAALKVDGARLEELFAGQPVVIKRDADTATAARYQAAFKRAGARLRVLPVADRNPAAPTRATAPAQPTSEPGLSLRPRGTDLLDSGERPAQRVIQVDVSHLSLAALGPLIEPRAESAPAVPDTSRFTLAEPGADLGAGERIETLEVTLYPAWELAPPGALLGGPSKPVKPAVDLATVDFDLAPTGADLGQRKAPPAPPAPDTSHLELTRN